jgi:hypothetical protein
MKLIKLSVALVVVVLSTLVVAQTQPALENGFKAYGSYDGSNLDTVNVMNGNLILHIPMPFTYPQGDEKVVNL